MTRIKSLLLFIFHQVFGTWGIAFLAAFGLSGFFDALNAISPRKTPMHAVYWLLSETPFYPVQIVAGLYFGWLLGRRFQHKCMLWIWIFPLAILVYIFATMNLHSSVLFHDSIQARLSFFFGWTVNRRELIVHLFTTMPFYASVAYSVGALVARKRQMKTLKNDSGIAEIAFGPG